MEIGIIGGGASGMMAAITAAKDGARVTILEKNDRIGRKLLATGNGKCNFTNKTVKNADYFSQCGNIYNDYISQFNEKRVISFFEDEGMLVKEKNGWCYPRSEQASTVLDILRRRLREERVEVITRACPSSLAGKEGEFRVVLPEGKTLPFDRLILACGSFAGQGGREEAGGYAYAENFGHSLVPVTPALVQLRAEGKEFKAIAGVRCEAIVTLCCEGKAVASEAGELQLTDYGISGIPVFQLSRHASCLFRENSPLTAVIDFLPEYREEELRALLNRKWERASGTAAVITAEEFFLGILHKKLNLMFLRQAGISPGQPVGECGRKRLAEVFGRMKAWKIRLAGTKPYENAQVCAGGVPLAELTLKLESRKVKGLYFAGEMLDVDGRCGGYNLQWAWSSGYIAGKYAAGSA